MDIKQRLKQLVVEIVGNQLLSIEAATNQAEEAIKALPEYEQLVNQLVRTAVRELVYDARHAINVSLKRDVGYYKNEAKVNSLASTTVNRVYESYYNYCIAGKTLGTLLGCELSKIAEKERGQADGHMFNAKLCEELRSLVRDDQLVKDTVPESRIKLIFKRLKQAETSAA